MFLANRKHTIQGSFGSLIAYSGLHVNPMANLIQLSTFSTPDINAYKIWYQRIFYALADF